MRWYILRALLKKEFARHLANRGGIALALLLIAAAGLLSVFAPQQAAGNGTDMVGGVHHCYIEFDRATPLVKHLDANQPPELKSALRFEKIDPVAIGTLIQRQPGTGSIQVTTRFEGTKPVLEVHVWHPDGQPEAMAAYEAWFWKETRRALAAQVREKNPALPPDPDFSAGHWQTVEAHAHLKAQADKLGATVPELHVHRKGLAAPPLDFRSAIATGLVVFALYFSCVYLLPTLNCEERERGVLLAQALSPASPSELLLAKFVFYPAFGLGLAAALSGIYKPQVLSSLFFWLSLCAVGGGFLGIGMTIAAWAKTQRAAFLGGMCYLLSVSMVLLICSTNGIPFLSNLAVEYHGPRILHAALSGNANNSHWLHLMAAIGLASAWLFAAGWVFRRRGWQ
ncbi:MAG: ABC transporter permease [Planctomycetes bacterium]|nr:ABC transporter permease [Planctomycetota bacterium]